jgi:hypothetical protein
MTRRFQFSLRALLLVTAAIAIASWGVVTAPPALTGLVVGFLVAPLLVIRYRAIGLMIAIPIGGLTMAVGNYYQWVADAKRYQSGFEPPFAVFVVASTILVAEWLLLVYVVAEVWRFIARRRSLKKGSPARQGPAQP